SSRNPRIGIQPTLEFLKRSRADWQIRFCQNSYFTIPPRRTSDDFSRRAVSRKHAYGFTAVRSRLRAPLLHLVVIAVFRIVSRDRHAVEPAGVIRGLRVCKPDRPRGV